MERTSQSPGATPRRWPVRSILFGVVFALVLPGLVFCAVLIYRIATGEHARADQAVRAAAARVSEALDHELASLSAALVVLSTSPALERADLQAFYSQATALAQILGQPVLLADNSGKQLLNTRRPYGEDLPSMTASTTFGAVLAARATAVSGLFTGAVSKAPSVALLQPVLRAGAVRGVLGVSLQPEFLSALLQRQGLPPGWIATLIDNDGNVLARTLQPEQFVGRRVPVDPPAQRGESVLATTHTLEGTHALTAAQWLHMANWRVDIDAPVRQLQAPLMGTLALLGITGVITLGIAVLLAWRLADSVAVPLQALALAGGALGRGGPVVGVSSVIAEVDAVSAALVRAHAEAARFTSDLERQVAARTAELEHANQRLRDAMERSAQAEELLRQSQKMEAVGQLTGGIAHDFNNLLTIVIGSLDLLRRRADDGRQRRLLDNALEGATRAATLTARLLAFSRRQPLQPQPVDVNRLVAGMSDLLHRTLGEAVQLETVMAGGVWQTHADPNQLENALLNLAVNGRDALATAERSGGRIVIETTNAVLAGAELDPDVAPGDFVQIAVSDSGAGMPPDVVGRVFEPFFTTKPQGQGTGLGLSQVHGFVKQSGGQVRIRTAPDQGTTVTIHLPRFVGLAVPIDAPVDEAPPAAMDYVVLLVEDDGGVRRFSVEALRDLGCTVLEADSGAQALRLLEGHPEVTVLLTDVVLPGISGVTLAAQVGQLRPGLPVLFASGYTGEPDSGNVLPKGAVLLQKPFTVQALAAKLRSVLTPG